MRNPLALAIAAFVLASAIAGEAAFAEAPGTPGQGSGIGPGQSARPPLPATEPPSGPLSGPPPAPVCDPSFRGKYSGLLRRLAVPEDAAQYGRCRDYGTWTGTQYKGHTNLPPNAFWTYGAPHWYLWARRGDAAGAAGCPDPSFGGKYSNELRRLNMPVDVGRYGRCNDYGRWAGNAYAGHTDLPQGFWVYSYPLKTGTPPRLDDLPQGFWVYSYPNWIIYANRRATH